MKGNFVSCSVVCSMIARSHKHLVFDKWDVVEWCAEAIKNVGNFESFKHFFPEHDKECHLKIRNKQALLPCGVYRLLGVYHRGNPMNNTDYIRNDNYLRFIKHHDDWDVDDGDSDGDDGFIPRRITIDYIGVPVDEEGMPKIDEIMIQACYWYCLKMLMLEDYMNGKVSPQVYNMLDENYGKYVQKAKSSFKNTSRNDMDEISMILLNMIPKIRLPRNMT
jgi:hypothetical protein